MLRNLKFNSFTSTTNSTTHSAVAYVYSFNEHRLFHETSNITHLKTIRVLNVFFWYRKTEQKKSFIEFVYKRKGFVFSEKFLNIPQIFLLKFGSMQTKNTAFTRTTPRKLLNSCICSATQFYWLESHCSELKGICHFLRNSFLNIIWIRSYTFLHPLGLIENNLECRQINYFLILKLSSG